MAIIVSRRALVDKINALPENAEIILVSNTRELVEGRWLYDSSVDVVGVHPMIVNERVAFALQSVLTWIFSGVTHRGS